MPATYTITSYNGGNTNIEFTAIKVGDIGQLVAEPTVSDASRSQQNLVTVDRVMEENEMYTIPFTFADALSANTVTFTLDLDAHNLELVEIRPGALTKKGVLDFVAPHHADAAGLAATWYSLPERHFTADEVLFEVVVRAKQGTMLSQSLSIGSELAPAVAKGREGGIHHLKLDYQQAEQERRLVVFQNAPNPFVEKTIVGFYVPEAGFTQMIVRDAHGKAVLRKSAYYDPGYQEWIVSQQDLKTKGLLFL